MPVLFHCRFKRFIAVYCRDEYTTAYRCQVHTVGSRRARRWRSKAKQRRRKRPMVPGLLCFPDEFYPTCDPCFLAYMATWEQGGFHVLSHAMARTLKSHWQATSLWLLMRPCQCETSLAQCLRKQLVSQISALSSLAQAPARQVDFRMLRCSAGLRLPIHPSHPAIPSVSLNATSTIRTIREDAHIPYIFPR